MPPIIARRAAALAALIVLALLLLPAAARAQEEPLDNSLYLSAVTVTHPGAVVEAWLYGQNTVPIPAGAPTYARVTLYRCTGETGDPYTEVCEDEVAQAGPADNGLVVFGGLEPGRYQLVGSAQHFLEHRTESFDLSAASVHSRSIYLSAASQEPITIHGRLVNEGGGALLAEGLARLRLEIHSCANANCSSVAVAGPYGGLGSDGSFVIETGYPPGLYWLVVSDFEPYGEYQTVRTAVRYLLPGDDVDLGEIHVAQHSVLVRGRVVDAATGEPPAQVSFIPVYLARCTAQGCSQGEIRRPDDEGRFFFGPLQPGRYSLTVVSQTPYRIGGREPFELAAVDRRDLGDVELPFPRFGRSIAGRLTGADGSALTWSQHSAGVNYRPWRFNQCIKSYKTDYPNQAGSFSFPVDTQSPLPVGGFVLRVALNSSVVETLGPFDLPENAELDLGSVALSESTPIGLVAGRMVRGGPGGGAPLYGSAQLSRCGLCGCDELQRVTGIGSDGLFRFEGDAPYADYLLPAGEYFLYLYAPELGSAVHGPFEVAAGEDIDLGDVEITDWQAAVSEELRAAAGE